jgi:DNA-binding TFAR19-related protein (PDSD5 family)
MMDEINEIKARKMQEMLASGMQNEQDEKAEFERQVSLLEEMVKKVLTKEAFQRYCNVRAASPESAVKVLAAVGQMMQSGKIKIIDDGTLRSMLERISPRKREIRIIRK